MLGILKFFGLNQVRTKTTLPFPTCTGEEVWQRQRGFEQKKFPERPLKLLENAEPDYYYFCSKIEKRLKCCSVELLNRCPQWTHPQPTSRDNKAVWSGLPSQSLWVRPGSPMGTCHMNGKHSESAQEFWVFEEIFEHFFVSSSWRLFSGVWAL